MCGITGVYNFGDESIKNDDVVRMNEQIIHRGPDSGKVELYGNCALGHRRLSIIDLSESANQPMTSSNDRYVMVYNGEVYNFLELKATLLKQGVEFRTSSDSEVILEAFNLYGSATFKMLNGMFAIAILDKHKKELTLARDPFGIKPFYYYQDESTLVFGSEMKAIKQYDPTVNLTINEQAFAEYLWYGNPLGDNTFYQQINELPSGYYMTVSNKGTELVKYFDINEVEQVSISEAAAVEKTRELLEEAVKRHLISDVPVGVFLSGGIDSSAITAFASKHYKGKLNTYSVKFDFDKGENELPLARKVAETFNTNHHEVEISGNDIIQIIEKLVDSHDEPFGDAADIPLYLLTEKLKGSIKVVLQGDGGDEFFGGYSRYNTISSRKKWQLLKPITPLLSILKNTKLLQLKRFVEAISQDEAYKRNALLLTMESKYSNPSRILNEKWKKKLQARDPFMRYREVYNEFDESLDETQRLFYTDAQIILKDTFFEKVDKSTMANSMEVRVPFIDRELTAFSLSLPSELKTKHGEQKYLLKKALRGVIPDEILDGKKKGFGVPYGYWLKVALEDYFKAQIGTTKVKEYLNESELLNMYAEHKKDKGNYGFLLWKTLIFAVWLNKQEA